MAEESKDGAASGNKKLIIIIAVVALAVAGAAVGITLALSGGDKPAAEGEAAAAAEEPPAEAVYVDLKPEFVINFRDRNNRPKFLKAEMSVSTHEPEIEEAVNRHMPAIRNSLVLLLSRQIYEDLLPNEGKEALRQQALAEVQSVLEAQIGKPGVDELYFSSFVMH
ncbi:MAG: flagellar basal body-associated FliL family protein [Gammaproteobacteria bacterium]|nr:flagellar basal body-associated FliL family protein [Gammaproteobacteria bacterium]MCP5202286.1 flagellar basal body-associated FliL family protein [Gammaproteobacteria bacterium]